MQAASDQGFQCLELSAGGPVLEIWLNRPEVLNAFHPLLIAELTAAFNALATSSQTRAVVLGGRGKMFCSGGDLDWMRAMASYTAQQNLEDARRLGEMLQAVYNCPVPLLGRVQGGAYGGALGLLACCDTVICAKDSHFAFSEVRIGLAPATIAPYVLKKIGLSGVLDLFLSGERFDAEQALAVGLAHCCVRPNELDDAVYAKLEELLKAGPAAARATKKLLREAGGAISPELAASGAQLIADLRVSPEGQEGLSAFREKRQPRWQESE